MFRVLAGSIGAGAGYGNVVDIYNAELKTEQFLPKQKPKDPVVTPKPDQQNKPEISNQSSTSKPTIVIHLNRNMSDGLSGSTTYGSQGIVKTREVVIALQRVEKEHTSTSSIMQGNLSIYKKLEVF